MSSNKPTDSYPWWPKNLYDELSDMAALSFAIFGFAYIMDTSRKHALKGLEKDIQNLDLSKAATTTTNPNRQVLTPKEVLEIIEQNRTILAKEYPSTFKDGEEYKLLIQNLTRMQERAEQFMSSSSTTNADPPLTVQCFDDLNQNQQLVYGITQDDINKRIIIVFRGTENELAFRSNWSTNLSCCKQNITYDTLEQEQQANEMAGTKITKTSSQVNGAVDTKILEDCLNRSKAKRIRFHYGFYNYMFGDLSKTNKKKSSQAAAAAAAATTTTKNSNISVHNFSNSKYNQILENILSVLESIRKKNPSEEYKVYVTGHSLGAALSTLLAFYLASEPDNVIPKPVMNVNFGSPRVGNYGAFLVSRELERTNELRILRVVNDKDSITAFPIFGFHHMGMLLRLYHDAKRDPKLDRVRENESWFRRMRRSRKNSLLRSFNLGYDHGDYRQRINSHEKWISKQPNVIGLYETL